AALGWQFVDAAHDQLPFHAVGLDARAEQLVRHQVRHFVGHRLPEEVLAVCRIQLGIEAQQVLVEVRDAGLLPAQPEADLGTGEGALEEIFGLPVAGLDAGVEQFGHGGDYAPSPPLSIPAAGRLSRGPAAAVPPTAAPRGSGSPVPTWCVR